MRTWNSRRDYFGPEAAGVLRDMKDVVQHLRHEVEKFMATKEELQRSMDDLKTEVARTTEIDTAIKQALDGQTTLIQSLRDQIAQLPAAGVLTQDELDAIKKEADDTLSVAKSNNDDLAAKITQNTDAAPAPTGGGSS